MAKPIGLEAVTETSTTDVYGVGTTFMNEATGKKFVWVVNAGADAIAAGDVVALFKTTPSGGRVSVTAATVFDSSDGTTTRARVAGIGVGAIAAASYGFLQCGGYCTNITTDTNITAGMGLICADGAKLATPNTTDSTAHWCEFGFADLADTAAVGTGYLTNCVYTAL